MVSLLGLGNVAVRATAAGAVVVGLALGWPSAASVGSVLAERAVAVAAAQGGLSATAASHPRKAPKKRRIAGFGAYPCRADRVVQPRIELDVGLTALPQLGVPFEIQIRDFAQDEPVEVVVTRPDGSQRSKLIRPEPYCDIHSSYIFLAYPPDPLGLYRVVATQGSRTATVTFTLLPPLRPSFNVLRFRLRAGKSVPFVLAGFDPGETVAMYLYRRGHNGIYRRARHPVRTIRVDQQGFALGNVTMRRGGRYLLSADAVFYTELERRGTPIVVR